MTDTGGGNRCCWAYNLVSLAPKPHSIVNIDESIRKIKLSIQLPELNQDEVRAIANDQNEIFKVLTIVSVVGIPPTLIASMYGMNFHSMPELGWRWGYPYGLALIALSIILPILWFKRRGWW